MKALYFEKIGEPSKVLTFGEIEKPEPGFNEVRLRVIGSPINPADELFINGKYRNKPVFPQTAGLEGAGIIDATGPNVDLPSGALAAFLQKNGWAEYVIVPVENLYLLPEDFPVDKAVQFSLNPFTAWGLLEAIALKENEWLLLTAGGSAVSRIITQLAAERKINVIVTVRNGEGFAELKLHGAREVIDTSSENLSERVMEITEGAGVNGILDCVGGKIGTELFKAAGNFAKIIIYGILSGEAVEFHNSQILFKNLTVRGFGVREFLQNQNSEQRNHMVRSLIDAIKKESFQLDVMAGYPLER